MGKIHDRIKVVQRSTPAQREALNLRDVNIKELERKANEVPEGSPLLVDFGDAYGIYGKVAELNAKFYECQVPQECAMLLAQACAAAQISGASMKLIQEWADYNFKRRGFKRK